MSLWDFPTKPALDPDSCRMFESDLVERFSRFHPANASLAAAAVSAACSTDASGAWPTTFVVAGSTMS